ncbi:pilus assembly protein TadG-related protein [Jatrophihabitans fulvus]
MTRDDRGSIIPLVLGFFVIALLVVGGSTALGQAFVQQRDLQSTCDGAAAAAAADAGDLDRGGDVGEGASLRFADVDAAVGRYLARDPDRDDVTVRASLSSDRTRITLRCERTQPLAFGGLIGRATVRHTAVSTARAAVQQ